MGGSDAELSGQLVGGPQQASELKEGARADPTPQSALQGVCPTGHQELDGGRRLVYADDPTGRDRPVPLLARPDPSAEQIFRLPLKVVAEVTPGPRVGPDDAEGRWAVIAPGELQRFGAPSNRELWLCVDGQTVRWVGGRSGPEGEVWFDESTLPQGKGNSPQILVTDPLEADFPREVEALPLDSLADAITEDVLRRLQVDGYAIVDDVLPPSLRDRLRDEMEALLVNDQYWESQSYGSDEGALHHSIVETTLDFKEVAHFAPTFARMETDQGLLRRLRRMPTLAKLRKQHLRLQVNKGNGGCYTMHTDSGVTETDTGAQVLKATALFYLNKDWCENDGGELRLFPFPAPPVKIPPLDGRLVLFEPRMVHEVLPNFRKRYCFTLWCALADEEASRNSFLDMDLECVTGFERAVALSQQARRSLSLPSPVDEGVPAPLRALFLPEVRPIIVRYVWRECELESARKSHNDGPQKREMLEGIAGYHEEMKAFNPRWLRDLLESVPNSSADMDHDRQAALVPPGNARRVGSRMLAELVREHCPWWE